MIVPCPEQLDVTNAVLCLKRCVENERAYDLILDFLPLNFVYPTGALLLAIGLKDIYDRRESNGLKTKIKNHKSNRNAISYLRHFGFFQFIGIDVGNPTNVQAGTTNYFPITTISRGEFVNKGKVLQDEIRERSIQLAQVIYRQDIDSPKVAMLSYCLQEIIRNVFEHASIDECTMMAQHWKNGAELVIVDRGIGIYSTLKKAHDIHTVKQALKLSILPGITCNKAPENNDIWQNSGFGLYVVSELGKHYGKFTVASNGMMMIAEGDRCDWENVNMDGTLVALRVSARFEYFHNLLEKIVAKGEEQAKSIIGARKSASKGSRSLVF